MLVYLFEVFLALWMVDKRYKPERAVLYIAVNSNGVSDFVWQVITVH